ncbi:DUF4367 domain-containing protein [Brevibacillus panacihumi]|uniref:DUF4367 domain-containing protein n=1 Tax=Brevibacillus panacihumi TaxID=497735 RepID=UPI003D2594E1
MKKGLAAALLTTAVMGASIITPGMVLANSTMTTSVTEMPEDLFIGITVEAASQKAGFPVKQPSYVPEGFHLGNTSYAGKFGLVSLSYVSFQKGMFHLQVRKGSLQNEAATFTQKTELQLVKGKAISGKKKDTGENQVLVWEDAGIIYQLTGGLAVEELAKIANSVGIGTPPPGPEIISMESSGALTREQASEKIGFPIKVPTNLPQGMKLSIVVLPGKESEMVFLHNKVISDEIPSLSIMIRKGDLKTEAYGRVPEPDRVQETTLGSATAYVGMFPGTSAHNPKLTERMGLTFEAGPGEIYTIMSELPLEDIKKIAESLQ